ncbi:DUF115 domain-containing protein [bacterium]|nr:DUF115 domain-containing protein [bacterium]
MMRAVSDALARNRAALATHQSELLGLLEAAPTGRFHREGDTILATTAEGERRVGLASPDETRRWLWEHPLERTGCGAVFAFGLADGAHLPLLAARLSPHAQLFILEPSPALAWLVLSTVDLADFLSRPNTHLLVGDVGALASGVESLWSPVRREGHPVETLAHPDLEWLEPGWAEELERELEHRARLLHLALRGELSENEHIVEHTLENVAAYACTPGIGMLAGILSGQSVLVATEGDSLSEALGTLVRYRHRVAVLASAGALRPCLAAGLAPDFVVVTDARPTADRAFQQLEAPEETALILEPRVSPLTWRRAEGRRLAGVFSDRWGPPQPHPPAGAWLERTLGARGELLGTANLALTMAALAVHLGARMVLMLEPDPEHPGLGTPRFAGPLGVAPRLAPDREAVLLAGRRQVARWAAEQAAEVVGVARNAPWPGLPALSLAEALTASWADGPQLHRRLADVFARFRPSRVERLLEEIDAELYHPGDYPIPSLSGLFALLAQRVRWEAARLRQEAEWAPGGGRRAEMAAAATAHEEAGLAAAHRRLRALLLRLARRLRRRDAPGGSHS